MKARKAPLTAAYVILLAATGSTALAECTAPPNWFPHKDTPEPDNHKPASNCEFHQWAWQEFLVLTKKDANNRLRFETLPTDKDLLTPGGTPVAFEKVATTSPLTLFPRVNQEEGPKKLGDILQAESGGVAGPTHQKFPRFRLTSPTERPCSLVSGTLPGIR
jgi:hypothetical protein